MSIRIDSGGNNHEDFIARLTHNETMYMLVANDDVAEGAVIREALFENLYACDVVRNAEDAVRAFCARDYDMILLSLRSTLSKVLESVKTIREHERHFPEPRIPVFILSAAASDAARQEAVSVGVDDVVATPRDYAELCKIISKATSLQRRTPPTLIPREPLNYQTLLVDNNKDEAKTSKQVEEFAKLLRETIRDVRTALAAKDLDLVRRSAEQMRQMARSLKSGRVQRTAYLLTKLEEPFAQAAARGRELLRELEQAENDLAVWRELQLGQIVVGSESKTRSKVSPLKLSNFLKKKLDVFSKSM